MARASRAISPSLLASIRSHLHIGSESDSESSQSTTATVLESRTQPGSPTTPLEENILTPRSAALVQTADAIEPFPAFDEEVSEKQRQWQCAYHASVMAGTQAQIRRETINPAIIAPADQPENKQVALNRVKEHLSNPHLCWSTRARFIALTNLVIRLDHILFRSNGEFLNSAAVADAAVVVAVILRYFIWMNGMLHGLVAAADHVFGALHPLSAEDMPVIFKYRQMAQVASAHLRKPKELEEQLLALYQNLFDEWIHERFLHMSNRKILHDIRIEPACLELISHVHDIWELLMRSATNYTTYMTRLDDIRRVYGLPFFVMTEMAEPPEIDGLSVSGAPLQVPKQGNKRK
ncbi:hypothetical protein PDE_02214 [Penicillium oxalicum 114-2]|uniref:Uncharacterized protein n=1 Tax=Penicillium oxalicum (strain 114-2 / CGMCC 5302) TaxID=933388 RepID=S7ZF17_PENO1|nr:hypothetical protein PDE_02214 [Penicillium oxalicum 114-2]